MKYDDLLEIASFQPSSIQPPNSWCGHIPFAAWLVKSMRPRVIVELGSHSGNSYFAFCQAVGQYGTESSCYAIDTWQGDEHAGYYGDEVYERVSQHNLAHFSGFSQLLRMTFDDALGLFADGSIDLLHIDGLHTYEAVLHDFTTWLPKLAPGAVVLFHDTAVKEMGFGVWQLWAELQERYSSNLAFIHSHGLGVLQLNADSSNQVEWLAHNFAGKETIKNYFEALGERQMERYAKSHAENEANTVIKNLSQALAERDNRIEHISLAAGERTKSISSLKQVLVERDKQIAELNKIAIDHEQRIADLANRIVAMHKEFTLLAYALRVFKSALWLGYQLSNAVLHPSQAYQGVKDFLIIRNSSLFDSGYYVSNYLDVCASGCNPILHYCEFGWKEGRNPSPTFNTNFYLTNNPDIAAHRLNPFAHYIRHGILENRYPAQANAQNPSPEVSENFIWLPPSLSQRAELMSQPSDGIHRVLVIDHAVPTPDMDSGSVRMFGILQLIAKLGSIVTFAADNSECDTKYVTALKQLEIDVLLGYADIIAHLEQWGSRYAVVIISRPEIAEKYMAPVRAYAAQAEFDYDTVDLHYLRFKRGSEVSGNAELNAKADFYYQLEMLCCNSADRVFAVTETEKMAILENWPNSQVEVIPNIHSINVSSQPWSTRNGLVFIGSYNHQPNVDAVLWFVHQILPIIIQTIPDITFTILGSNPPESVKSLASNNVIVLGWVPEPEIYFSSARVFVAPLRYGAGMKGKVGQAMSVGLPVVTTTIGAEGIGLMDNVHALIADDPEYFASAVIRLHKNEALWKSIQQKAVVHIERNFSESSVETILQKIWSHRQKN